MKLKRIEIQAFGVLESFQLDFTDGGQAFFALNESGKSTCLAFIRCALYGMPRNTSNLAKSLRRRYQPFSKEYSAGSLIFEHEGRDYRLTRHFAERPAGDRTEFRDEYLGDVISLKNPSAPGVELLGMEEGAFLNTAFVAQMEVPYSVEADKDGALIKHLTDLGSTGDAEASITSLRERLTEAENHLSSTRRTFSLIPQLEQEIEALATEEAKVRARRDEVADIEAEITRQDLALEEAEAELGSLKKYQELERLEQQAEQIEEGIERSKKARSQVAGLKAQREAFESGEAFDAGEGPRHLAQLVSELRSRQDGQLARWRALQTIPETLDAEVKESLELTQALLQDVQAQQKHAEAATRSSEELQGKLQELQADYEKKEEDQRERLAAEQEALETFRETIRSKEAEERSVYAEIELLEKQDREEGFRMGQVHLQALKTYAEPYMESLAIGSEIQALTRQEMRILRELEGQDSEAAQEMLTKLSKFTADRIAFTESLEDLPDDYQHETASFDDWRKMLNLAPQKEEEAEIDAEVSHIEKEDFDTENLELSPEGKRMQAEHEALLLEAEEISRQKKEAEEALKLKREAFYEKRSEIELQRKLISDVRTPSRAGMAFWPLLAVICAILGILSIVWMIRSDYLYLVLAAMAFGVTGFAVYRFIELRNAFRLADEVQRRRFAAAQAETVVEEAKKELQDAEAQLESLRSMENELRITVNRSSMDWDGRKEFEAGRQKTLHAMRQKRDQLKVKLAQLDAILPQRSQEFSEHDASFQAEEKKRSERLEQARKKHQVLKAEVDGAIQELAEVEKLNEVKAASEEEQTLKRELQTLRADIEQKRQEIRDQGERIRRDRAKLEEGLKQAGFDDVEALKIRHDELRGLRDNHATRLKNSKEEALKLNASLRLLDGDWSKLLYLGQALYSGPEDIWQTTDKPIFKAEELTQQEAMTFLEDLQQELQRLDMDRKEKEQQYNEILAQQRTAEAALTSQEEEARQLAKQEEIQASILRLKADDVPIPADVEAEIRQKEQLIRQLTADVSGLRASIQHEDGRIVEDVLREKLAIEEALSYRRLQLEAIKRAQEAADMAYKEIRERFSPQLQAFASEYLERITEGRYRRLIVKSDEKDMILEVFDEMEGRAIEAEYLSGAAYEQIYLALRLGMIRMLDPEHKLPLFFDDTLVQFDLERERACLNLFNELVKEGRQIIYLTCSEAMADRIKEVAPMWEVRPLI